MLVSVPMIDFGLVRADDVGKFTFEVTNHSEIPAEILFRERSANDKPKILSSSEFDRNPLSIKHIFCFYY